MRACFLFQARPEKRPGLFWAWNWVMILLSSIGIGWMGLVLAYGHYPRMIYRGYFSVPLIAVLNILPCVLMMLFFYCLIGKAHVAYAVTAGLCLGCATTNFYMLKFRNDPFLLADFSNMAMGLRFGGSYGLTPDLRLIVVALVVVAGGFFLWLFVRGRIPARRRLWGALLVALTVFPLKRVYLDDEIYQTRTANFEHANPLSATEVFLSKGFLYPFLYSFKSAFPTPPTGYSEREARAMLAEYTSEDIPEAEKVNLIAIQLEAFSDLTKKGVSGIDESVYAQLHALEAESVSGDLVTNVFAGGTVNTERCILTGNSSLENFRRDTSSYGWYLRDQGYVTEGSHPCYQWFYNRENINRYLGLEQYYYFENRYYTMSEDGSIPYDDVLLPDIWAFYQARDPSAPYFNFSVTYQGHGPYPSDTLRWGGGFYTGGGLTDASDTILQNYLGSVADTQTQILGLVEQLRNDDAPCVLILWGDHMPWLGDNNSVYTELGVNLDLTTEEGFRNYYTTPYVIWANDAARETLDCGFTGDGPAISPCFLMNLVFNLCGWDGPAYMQLAGETMARVPVINTSGYLVDGDYVTALSGDAEALVQRYAIAQFYRKRNFTAG